MNPFDKSSLTTILVVSNPSSSKNFYVDLLGAKLYREYGEDSVVLNFLNSWILLVSSGGPTADKPETVFLPPTDANKVSHAFTIRVKNCMESYNTLKQKGIKFITPPVENGSETRCFFHDPDGHLFEISEYRS